MPSSSSSAPPASPPEGDKGDAAAEWPPRRHLRQRLKELCPTEADLDALCLDHLPEVQGRLASTADLLARQNLILSLVEPAQLTAALDEWEHEPRSGKPARRQRSRETDPLIERVFAACRHRERHQAALQIRLLPKSAPGLRLAAVSYKEFDAPVQYGLGITAQRVELPLLQQFSRMLNLVLLDTQLSGRPRLIYHLPPGSEPPSPAVVQAAREARPPITLVSLDTYEAIIDLGDAVRRQSQRLSQDPRYPPTLYVPQRMQTVSGTGLRFGKQPEPALETVLSWLERDGGRFILLLGDFGTGKTFLLREVARRLGQPASPLQPLFCELRHIEKAQDLDTMLVQHMQREQIYPPDPQALRHMARLGKVVFLFDGFDELALRTDYHRAAQHLETLIAAVEGEAKVIITSRTQHFLTDAQIATVLAQRLERVPTLAGRLLPFVPAQIRLFLNKQLSDEARASARYALLGEVKDLLGLSANPRMLSLIAQLDEARLRAHGQIGAAQLYQSLVDQWVDFEIERKTEGVAGPMLTAAQLGGALDRLAVVLWRKTEPTATLDELEQATSGILKQLDLEPGVAAQQLGSSSLLCRDGQGRFFFFHHSLLEWLVARQIKAEIERNGCELLAEKAITPLMAEFLRGFLGDAAAGAWARRVLSAEHDGEPPGPQVQSALVVAERMRLSDLIGLSLAGQDLRGRDFTELSLRKAELRGADLREVSLVKQDLRGAVLAGANLEGANLGWADLRGADLSQANLTRANLAGADLRGAKLTGAVLSRAKLLGAQLSEGALATAASTDGAAVSLPLAPMTLPRLELDAQAPYGTLAFSPREELLAVSTQGWDVALCSSRSGECLRVLSGHHGAIRCIAFSPDGRRLASASQDGTVKLWDVHEGLCLRTLTGFPAAATSVAFAPDGRSLAVGSEPGSIALFALPEGTLICELADAIGGVSSLAFAPDGKTLASGSLDRTVRLWDVATRLCMHMLSEHKGRVNSIAFGAAGATLASGSSDGTVILWDVPGGRRLNTLTRLSANGVTSLAYCGDGSLLAVGCAFSTSDPVQLWDLHDSQRPRVRLLKGLAAAALALDAEGKLLAVRSLGGMVTLWDVPSGQVVRSLATPELSLGSIAFGAHGQTLISRSRDGMVLSWGLRHGDCERTLFGQSGDRANLAVDPERRVLAVQLESDSVELWELATHRHFGTIRIPQSFLGVCATALSAEKLAVGCDFGCALLFDIQTAELLHSLDVYGVWRLSKGLDADATGRAGRVAGLAFSIGGRLLALSHLEEVQLWDASSGAFLLTLKGHTDQVNKLAFAPRSLVVASGAHDQSIRVWDARKGQCLLTLTGHSGPVLGVAFHPDGRTLASGSRDRTIRLWNAQSGECVGRLEGHTDAVVDVAYHRAGHLLASASLDETVRLWELPSGRCLAVLVAQQDGFIVYDSQTQRFRYSGELGASFWFASGLCRFTPAEVAELFPELVLPSDHVLLPGLEPAAPASQPPRELRSAPTLAAADAAQPPPAKSAVRKGAAETMQLAFGVVCLGAALLLNGAGMPALGLAFSVALLGAGGLMLWRWMRRS